MAKKLGRVLLLSYFGFGFTFLIGSALLLFVKLESWACFTVPAVVAATLVFILKIRRKDSFILNFLQASAIAAGMTVHIGIFLLLGDSLIKPSALYFGQSVSQLVPDLIIAFTTFMIMANLLGSVPALLAAFLVIQFVQPPGD